METNVYDRQKYVEIWLTKKEAKDVALRESLKPIFAACQAKKCRVAVFESGGGDLLANTRELLRHSIEVEARGERDDECR